MTDEQPINNICEDYFDSSMTTKFSRMENNIKQIVEKLNQPIDPKLINSIEQLIDKIEQVQRKNNENDEHRDIIYELKQQLIKIQDIKKKKEEEDEKNNSYQFNYIVSKLSSLEDKIDALGKDNLMLKKENTLIKNSLMSVENMFNNDMTYLKFKLDGIDFHKLTLEYHDKIKEAIKAHSPIGMILSKYIENIKTYNNK